MPFFSRMVVMVAVLTLSSVSITAGSRGVMASVMASLVVAR
jgi:hypothetical protein